MSGEYTSGFRAERLDWVRDSCRRSRTWRGRKEVLAEVQRRERRTSTGRRSTSASRKTSKRFVSTSRDSCELTLAGASRLAGISGRFRFSPRFARPSELLLNSRRLRSQTAGCFAAARSGDRYNEASWRTRSVRRRDVAGAYRMLLSTMFLIAAVVGGTVLVCQFVLDAARAGRTTAATVGHHVGGDFHGDAHVGGDFARSSRVATSHADADAASGQHAWLFGVISFRTLVAAAAFFGVTGQAALSAGFRRSTSLVAGRDGRRRARCTECTG